MQSPTCTNTRIRSVHDAHLIFHAAQLGRLPIITRRLDTEERRAVRAGNVYVWEERGPNSRAAGLGIERWTDGIPWSASRVRDEFLFYHERDRFADAEYSDADTLSETSPPHIHADNALQFRLVKQTYSVMVHLQSGAQRKWHLTAYFVPATAEQLRTVEHLPEVADLELPEGMYVSAKMGKGRAREGFMMMGMGNDSGRRMSIPGGYGQPAPGPYSMYNVHPSPHMPPRGETERPSLQPAFWPPEHPGYPDYGAQSHLNRGQGPTPLLVSLPPLPQSPVNATYSPRHPLDDEALRSLRGVF